LLRNSAAFVAERLRLDPHLLREASQGRHHGRAPRFQAFWTILFLPRLRPCSTIDHAIEARVFIERRALVPEAGLMSFSAHPLVDQAVTRLARLDAVAAIVTADDDVPDREHTSSAHSSTESRFISICTTRLAMLRRTNMSPGWVGVAIGRDPAVGGDDPGNAASVAGCSACPLATSSR
jgi:hypothetical protein